MSKENQLNYKTCKYFASHIFSDKKNIRLVDVLNNEHNGGWKMVEIYFHGNEATILYERIKKAPSIIKKPLNSKKANKKTDVKKA